MTVSELGARREKSAAFSGATLFAARVRHGLAERFAGPGMMALGWTILLAVTAVNFIAFSIGLLLAGAFPRIFRIPNSRIASLQRRAAFTGR